MKYNPRHLIPAAAAMFLLATCISAVAAPDNDDSDNQNTFQVVPYVFVGLAPGCAPYPAGSNIVTSAWLPGLGLPDNTTSANVPSHDAHYGLLLNKNGPTADCSSAGARIRGFNHQSLTELGFDYRNGTHCGAGAPRFNVVTSDGTTHFGGGCANGTKSPAPQDPAQWTRVRIDPTNPAQMFPPIAAGTTIKSIEIVFDEGTDTPGTEDPMGVGLSTIDNIDINGKLVGEGHGIAPNPNAG